MRFLLLALCGLTAAGCMTNEDALRQRHGSPFYTHACKDGKTFMSRQIISGDVEVTAGGRTRAVADGDGNLIPGAPRLEPAGEAMRLTGMPGAPYEACVIDNESAG
jgi:hypothetical protein